MCLYIYRFIYLCIYQFIYLLIIYVFSFSYTKIIRGQNSLQERRVQRKSADVSWCFTASGAKRWLLFINTFSHKGSEWKRKGAQDERRRANRVPKRARVHNPTVKTRMLL